jgi:hypothetical protein
MHRTLQRALPGSLSLLAALALVAGGAACGGSVTGTGGGSSSSTSTDSSTTTSSTSTGGSCALTPPGKPFTFHIHNAGSKMLRLAYACGTAYPIELVTPQEKLAIGPGAVDLCEVTCDALYAGKASYPCSDCGPGTGANLPPGFTVNITWDRRTYTEYTPEPMCTPIAGAKCALGTAIGNDSMQQGILSVCSDADMQPDGYCSGAGTVPINFAVDTTKDEGTIEVP